MGIEDRFHDEERRREEREKPRDTGEASEPGRKAQDPNAQDPKAHGSKVQGSNAQGRPRVDRVRDEFDDPWDA